MLFNKSNIRWFLFKLFGPSQLKEMVEHIENMLEETESDAFIMYPMGNFFFQVNSNDPEDGDEPKTFGFMTVQERDAFATGLKLGVEIMGGSSFNLSNDDLEIIQEMSKKSTHGSGSGSTN